VCMLPPGKTRLLDSALKTALQLFDE